MTFFRSFWRAAALSIALTGAPMPGHAQSLEAQLEQQAAQQYRQLIDQARAKNALATPRNVDLQRLIRIQGRILPYTYAVNPLAREWHWEVNLLRSDQVNAFCMPGGKIAFFNGIIQKLALTDDEIAIVMGHEMTHALREHGVEQAKKRMAGSGYASIASAVASAFGINPYLANMGARAANGFIQLHFSRADESEADRIGLELAARAGFDPRAGVVLWQKMGRLAQRSPPAWLSDHPADRDRIADIQALLPKVMPLYADVLHTTVDRLPPYRTTPVDR
jgi:predicted Zn-dependent protease